MSEEIQDTSGGIDTYEVAFDLEEAETLEGRPGKSLEVIERDRDRDRHRHRQGERGVREREREKLRKLFLKKSLLLLKFLFSSRFFAKTRFTLV